MPIQGVMTIAVCDLPHHGLRRRPQPPLHTTEIADRPSADVLDGDARWRREGRIHGPAPAGDAGGLETKVLGNVIPLPLDLAPGRGRAVSIEEVPTPIKLLIAQVIGREILERRQRQAPVQGRNELVKPVDDDADAKSGAVL
jgi:hypothetical protein